MSNATFRFTQINLFRWLDRLEPGPIRLNAKAPWHHLPDEQATTALGAALAERILRGEAICLWGPLGSGKSTLARGLIRALTRPDEDVPSPTFTLVQFYEGPAFPLAHFDLYRLTSASEAYEIGLDEALEDGAALIEWPERLGPLLPADALKIRIDGSGEATRRLTVSVPASWEGRWPPK